MSNQQDAVLSSLFYCRARSEPGGTRWRTGGEVKRKLANGVGSQYSHATSERGLSSITQADAHPLAASSRLNWRPHLFKWTRPFRGKTISGFCACAITFRTSYTAKSLYMFRVSFAPIIRSTKNCSHNFLLLNGFYFYVTDIHDLYQWLWLQFYVLLMMGAKGTWNMQSDFAVQ